MNTKVGRDIVSHDRPSACIDHEVKRSKVRLKVRGRMNAWPGCTYYLCPWLGLPLAALRYNMHFRFMTGEVAAASSAG